MTLLDERVHSAQEPIAPRSRPSSTPAATWAFASRLARREVRRRPGRTLLVMLLVAIPVIGMTAASIGSRTLSEQNRDQFTEQYGQADFVANPGGAALRDTAELPDGTTSIEMFSAYTSVVVDQTSGLERIYVRLMDIDLSSPISEGIVDLVDGRAPTGSDEMLVSRAVADELGVEVGDRLRMVRPDVERTVVGIGRERSNLSSTVIVIPGFDRSLVRPGAGETSELFDLPGDVTQREYHDLAQRWQLGADGLYVLGRHDDVGWAQQEVTTQQLAWGWVAGMVGFVAVGIIITAAFATSARRQLVTIGQLTANGAPQRLVRRTMGLQGAWTGVLGALSGLAVAVAAAWISARAGWWDTVANRVVGPVRLEPLDLAVIGITAVVAATLAALIPARSASRIPVLTALAGRRPVGEPPRWLGRVGIAATLVGLVLLSAAASSQNPDNLTAAVALAGALSVLAGLVCASPLIVAAVGRIGARSGGTIRLAARSLDRSRVRSAAVLTAIATVGALATAGATATRVAEVSERDNAWNPDLELVQLEFVRDYYQSSAAEAEVRANGGVFDRPPERAAPLPDSMRAALTAALPEAVFVPVRSVVIDPPPINVDTLEEVDLPDGIVGDEYRLDSVVLYDEAVADRVELTDEQRTILDEDGIISTDGYGGQQNTVILTERGPVEVTFRRYGPEPRYEPGPSVETGEFVDRTIRAENGRWVGNALVTDRFVEANDLELAVSRYWVENPVDLTDEQRDVVTELGGLDFGDSFIPSASAPGYDLGQHSDFEAWSVYADQPLSTTPWPLIHLGVAVASLIFVLTVVAIGLSLSATESRDERNVLHAVGASPATLRRVAAAKAWVLTTGAAAVAVPAGYTVMFVVTRATDSNRVAPFPHVVALSLLLVIPAVAALTTWLASTIAQRRRPVMMSTFATD